MIDKTVAVVSPIGPYWLAAPLLQVASVAAASFAAPAVIVTSTLNPDQRKQSEEMW